MDSKKWKSVVITIDSYNQLKKMAREEHRTISGQFAYLLLRWKSQLGTKK
jgi:hypothetical protein